jgi:NPCBM/NEW2 domain/Chitobiase/beta-hexosaminidase C-terminal domain
LVAAIRAGFTLEVKIMRCRYIHSVTTFGIMGILLCVVMGSGGDKESIPPRHSAPSAVPAILELHTQTRDPKTDRVAAHLEKVDPRKVGVIIIDPWNYHWCMTWSEQAGGTVPRMNRALAGARQLGMQVLWAPTDVASMYAGVPQRERALAFPYIAVPNVREFRCPFTLASGHCHCGPGHACLPNYGHDAMPPDIDLAESDLIVSGTQELYSICRKLGLTHLIYLGGAVNLCLTGKPEGLQSMHQAGLEGWVARDMVEAWTHYDPSTGYTSDVGNAHSVRDLEQAGIATLHFADELRRLGHWDQEAITEPIRITPAGKPGRPYCFDQTVTVSLSTPWLNGAEIFYTLDGAPPTRRSTHYTKPLVFKETTALRAAAFRGERPVSLESSGYWVRRPAEIPKPEVVLDQLTPLPDQYAVVNPATHACLWHPKLNTSYDGLPLRIRGQKYQQGAGMRGPGYLRYELKPEWKRFVAQVGVADHLLDQELGRNIARFPSVVFKVFVDGKLAAESPVMRVSQAPWRLDVPLPAGSRIITLCMTDAGDRSPYDLGNWVDAGFVVAQRK